MDLTLSPIEIRILGSMIEKEITTPEYYPLTLNALTNACNQKNNREPVMTLEETTVVRTIENLREKHFVTTVTGAGIRVPKYKQAFTETLTLTPQEVAVMTLLMLRGPQTVGEIRGRSGPLFTFESLEAVQAIIDSLSANGQRSALVKKLSRQAGQKEVRFMHLLSGEPAAAAAEDTTGPEKARLIVLAENERIAKLEEDMKNMKKEIKSLRQQFTEFKGQFE
ncbi:MAG: YceH family protein [Ignavibacteriae bacterium]|nr:YceH family protein [Ignavibacteria bacterium]MBI3363325.1 YceH family protein [Ignavibacteriota bacterium]